MRFASPLLLLVASCASATREKPPENPAMQTEIGPQTGHPPDAGELPEAGLRTADKTLRPELLGGDSTYLGVLDRSGLNAIIDQGLGRLLARLKLSPALRGGRYEGFRVAEVDPAWADTGLVIGDVLMRVNGMPIERPEQAQVAFEALRVASEVALELMRDGQKRSIRYRVE